MIIIIKFLNYITINNYFFLAHESEHFNATKYFLQKARISFHLPNYTEKYPHQNLPKIGLGLPVPGKQNYFSDPPPPKIF